MVLRDFLLMTWSYRSASRRRLPSDFAMTAVLVRHPRGDVLIDTGFSRDVDAHLALMPLPFRATTSWARGRAAAQQLTSAGYDLKQLRAILLTHAHWDHASGLADFPDTPVWVTADEHRFIREGGVLTAVARLTADARYQDYAFEGGPYLGFRRATTCTATARSWWCRHPATPRAR